MSSTEKSNYIPEILNSSFKTFKYIENLQINSLNANDYFKNFGKFQEIGKRINKLTINSKLRCIKEKAFFTNFSLETIEIKNPDKLDIRRGAFANCYSLKSLIMNYDPSENNRYFNDNSNAEFFNTNENLYNDISENSTLLSKFNNSYKKTYLFNNKLINIGDYSFALCGKLTGNDQTELIKLHEDGTSRLLLPCDDLNIFLTNDEFQSYYTDIYLPMYRFEDDVSCKISPTSFNGVFINRIICNPINNFH